MTFRVPETFIAGTEAEAAKVNSNFSNIETELNAFPSDGKLKPGVIAFNNLESDLVETSGEGLTLSDGRIATSKLIREYIDDQIEAQVYDKECYGRAYRNSRQSNMGPSAEKLLINTLSNSKNTTLSNYKVTPQVAGHYQLWGQVDFYNSYTGGGSHVVATIRKNGSEIAHGQTLIEYGLHGLSSTAWVNCAGDCWMDGSSDYWEFWVWTSVSSYQDVEAGSNSTFFMWNRVGSGG
jgi:hypothetical protein